LDDPAGTIERYPPQVKSLTIAREIIRMKQRGSIIVSCAMTLALITALLSAVASNEFTILRSLGGGVLSAVLAGQLVALVCSGQREKE
jgi:ABC-type uncharacterized transport system permease subunit